MNFVTYLEQKTLLMDGAMGTYYQQLKGQREEISELANLSNREQVFNIHKEYLMAGADIIRTNTFAINSVVLSELSSEVREQLLREGCKIAKQAVAEEQKRSGRQCFVAGDIGPIAEVEEEQDILLEYYRMCDVFLEEGITIFWLETFPSTQYIAEVTSYIRKKAPESFIAVSFCINKNGFTASLQKAERLLFCEQVKEANAVGFNCGIGSVHLKNILEQCKFPKDKFILAAPNAGYAEDFSNRSVFLNSAGYFGKNMAYIQNLGVNIVGGCCGTTPFFIKEIKKQLNCNSETKEKDRISKQEYERLLEKEKQETKINKEKNKNLFKKKLLRGEKVIAVELDPPYNADGDKLVACANILSKQPIDILTFADSPMGRSRADSVLTALHIREQAKLQVMPHICCRDKNMIAMRSLLLGAHIHDLRNLLIVTGDPVPGEDRKKVTGVFDYNSIRLMSYVSEMNAELFAEDGFFYGGALNYNYPNLEKVAERMEKKMAAGCSFFMTQPIFSEENIRQIAWLKERTGAKILGGILPPVSLRNALFIKNEMAGMDIPDNIVDRYKENFTREEGELVGAEIAKELMKKLEPFVDGYYFMLPFNRVSLMEKIFTEDL